MNIDKQLLYNYIINVEAMRVLQRRFFKGERKQEVIIAAKMLETKVDHMSYFLLNEKPSEKLIKAAHTALTVKMGRPEYAPKIEEVSDWIAMYFSVENNDKPSADKG